MTINEGFHIKEIEGCAPGTGWMDYARCIVDNRVKLESYFPTRGRPVSIAKVVCGECPVRQECEDYANQSDTADGIFGGYSYTERKERLYKPFE